MANTRSPITTINHSVSHKDGNGNYLTPITNVSLPRQGLSRASQILPFLPFGSTTLWKWSKEGLFPSPIRISSTITAWRNADVLDWLEEQGSHDSKNIEEA